MKRILNNNGSALMTAVIVSTVLFLLASGLLLALSSSLKMDNTMNFTEQAYLTAKSGLNTFCDYFEDTTDPNEHDERIKALRTLTGPFDGVINADSGQDTGTFTLTLSKNNWIDTDGTEYIDVTVTSKSEYLGSEYSLYRVLTIPANDDDSDRIPYYDHAFVLTNSTGDITYKNGVWGSGYVQGTGTTGIKSSNLNDYLTNGNVGTYDGSSVNYDSITAGGYVYLVQSEVISGDVLCTGWAMIGGRGQADVLGKVYSETGVLVANSGNVGDPLAADYSTKDVVLSEGNVVISCAQYVVSTTWDSSILPYGANVINFESDGVTPVLSNLAGSGGETGKIYGNIIAKGDVYISSQAVYGNVYADGNVTISGGKVAGSVYCSGDLLLTNAENNNNAEVDGEIIAGGTVTQVGSPVTSSITEGAGTVSQVSAKIVSGTKLSTTATDVLDEAAADNQAPTSMVIPDYLGY